MNEPIYTSGFIPEKRRHLYWMARIFGTRVKEITDGRVIYKWRNAYWQWK